MPFVDKTLTCVECGQPFTFTAEDQEYHQSRGFENEPRRCPSCRAARRNASPSFQRSGGGGGGGSYGGGGPREMFPATCAQCGRETEVPFQPRNDRPVYCRDCFSKRAPARSSRY